MGGNLDNRRARKYQCIQFIRRTLGLLPSRNNFTLLLLTTIGLWCVKNITDAEFTKYNKYLRINTRKVWGDSVSRKQEMNLAFVLHNDTYKKQFYTLIKNILYHQGRSVLEESRCKLTIRTVQNNHCPRLNSRRVKPIHLHILTHTDVEREMRAYFMQLNLTKIRITYYDWRLALSQIYASGKELSKASVQTMKILWPELLGTDVKKAISLDIDLIFNQNVEELWKEFDSFRNEQMIGGVFEQQDSFQKHPSAKLFPILRSGVNTGVILLDLEKIRETNWAVWWRQVEKEMERSPSGIPYGDQGILNTMLYRRPEIFHEIPCEWNYIPNESNFKDYCLIAWVVRQPSRSECLPRLEARNHVIRLASIVHFAGMEKPEQILEHPYHGNPKPVYNYREFNAEDVRNTFMEVYYAHREMNISCFSEEEGS